MTTAHDIDLHQILTDCLTDASPDLLRRMPPSVGRVASIDITDTSTGKRL
ncbi:hypothetical protein [Rhodococcus sp. USK13]|nr:hypothetical protein [Rhodococcus sp. USK13]